MKQSLTVLAVIIILITFYGEKRKFYCIDQNCLTVWKTFNNNCYIIPGKYYGPLRPSTNYIHTTNTNNLTIYFTTKKPKQLFVKSDHEINIYNDQKGLSTIVDYRDTKYDSLFYDTDAKRNSDINKFTSLIDLFIQENYAIDKDGITL